MIWLNGAVLEDGAARIDPADRGFLLGDGVFETIRVQAGHVWHLDRHLARLRDGAAGLGIDIGWTDAEILFGIRDVLRETADAALRITLTRGPGPRGLAVLAGAPPTLLIAASALPQPAPPARVIIATRTQRNEFSPLCRIKSLNYLDSILARREAVQRGADEAILLNTAGRLAEACAGNLFLLQSGHWTTPPVADGALPGIARALILEAGLAREGHLAPKDLLSARGGLVSSALGLRAIAGLDDFDMDAFSEAVFATRAG